jgi:hypothetical protein
MASGERQPAAKRNTMIRFWLDAKGHMLFRGDHPVSLPPKAIDTLQAHQAEYAYKTDCEERGLDRLRNCAGIEGSQTASVTLIDTKTNTVVWAYNVRKVGSSNFQSSAEACAKHLKEWLEHKGK